MSILFFRNKKNIVVSRFRFIREIRILLQRWKVVSKLTFVVAAAAVLSCIATYGALTASDPLDRDPDTIIWLLNLDLALLLALGFMVAQKIVTTWVQAKRGKAGARLYGKFVSVFSLMAVVPAILMAIFSVVFFYVGVQSWFSEQVHTAVLKAKDIADSYLEEHQQTIRADILAMANDLNRGASQYATNPFLLDQVVRTQASLRNLVEAMMFDKSGRVMARSGFAFSTMLDSIDPAMFEQASSGEVVLMTEAGEDRVRALVQLNGYFNTYLMVGRVVAPEVISYLKDTKDAVNQYTVLEGRSSELQITLLFIFVIVTVLLLLAAVWVGFVLARQITDPISNLIQAAERVGSGDLTARVSVLKAKDEIGLLATVFNRMTDQIGTQQQDLIKASYDADQRRIFTEAVLSGVSAGVFGLDSDLNIQAYNLSAPKLLELSPEFLRGKSILEIFPDSRDLFEMAALEIDSKKLSETQISYALPSGKVQTFLIRISLERQSQTLENDNHSPEGYNSGYVVTFDDISALVAAQRKAAWSDVARRLAHEIKNPLTPIQLAAERMARKYGHEITSDPETFRLCTDTIIRQSDNIRRMVDEFSAFARMPQADLKAHDLCHVCRQVAFLQRQTLQNIELVLNVPSEPLMVECDGHQITQALINILKNAAESIQAFREKAGESAEGEGSSISGHKIVFSLGVQDAEWVLMSVSDTGIGFPDDPLQRQTLLEPYQSTKTKGSGLGLAIVRKIAEDHKGRLVLQNPPIIAEGDVMAGIIGKGAMVQLYLPRHAKESKDSESIKIS